MPLLFIPTGKLPMLSREITINRRQLIVCGSLLLMTLVVFGQTIRHGFVNFDDGHYVYANPLVWHGLTAPSIAHAFASGRSSLWVPVTWVSLMIDWEFSRRSRRRIPPHQRVAARDSRDSAMFAASADD